MKGDFEQLKSRVSATGSLDRDGLLFLGAYSGSWELHDGTGYTAAEGAAVAHETESLVRFFKDGMAQGKIRVDPGLYGAVRNFRGREHAHVGPNSLAFTVGLGAGILGVGTVIVGSGAVVPTAAIGTAAGIGIIDANLGLAMMANALIGGGGAAGAASAGLAMTGVGLLVVGAVLIGVFFLAPDAGDEVGGALDTAWDSVSIIVQSAFWHLKQGLGMGTAP